MTHHVKVFLKHLMNVEKLGTTEKQASKVAQWEKL